MYFAVKARKSLLAAGLATLALSLLFDPNFATDATSVPEPATAALVAMGGVAAVAASFIRRRKK